MGLLGVVVTVNGNLLNITMRQQIYPIHSILVEMGPDMVESFHGEELFRSEPLVCIVSQDQRFHMESYLMN